MASEQKTPFLNSDAIPNSWHFKLGRRLYGSNVDFIAETYINGEQTFVALIDWKYGGANVLKHNKVSSKIAKDYDISLFDVCWFLPGTSDNYDVPMYFVIPNNEKAMDFFRRGKFPLQGKWFSEYDYSRFEHFLRGIKADLKEIDGLSKQVKIYKINFRGPND